MSETPPPLRSYGRIKARALKPSQEAALAQLMPGLAIDPAAPPAVDVLEIGFGAGEHLAAQAARGPDFTFLGVEPFLNGVGACARQIGAEGLTNIRLHQGDVREVLPHLPAGGLRRVYLLFPDPWPKTRHHKRRLVQPDLIAGLARAMAPGAELRFATDWADYADWTLQRFTAAPAFTWTAERAADWRTPWPDHVPTRYEAKRLGDCAPIYLSFRRTGCPA